MPGEPMSHPPAVAMPMHPHGDTPAADAVPAGERVMRALEQVLALCFIGAVLLNFANVFGRYVLGYSMIGAEEVQTYTMVLITFMGAVVVAWRGKALRMDVLLHKLPARARGGLRGVESVVLVVCCGFTAWQSGRYAWQMHALDAHSDGAEIPMWLPHGVVALGLALMALVGVLQAVQRLRGQASDDVERVLH
jgi:TRAP-type C4-dicarboxylate transport system permease small subunit